MAALDIGDGLLLASGSINPFDTTAHLIADVPDQRYDTLQRALRWAGVPSFVRAGKDLARSEVLAAAELRCPPRRFFAGVAAGTAALRGIRIHRRHVPSPRGDAAGVAEPDHKLLTELGAAVVAVEPVGAENSSGPLTCGFTRSAVKTLWISGAATRPLRRTHQRIPPRRLRSPDPTPAITTSPAYSDALKRIRHERERPHPTGSHRAQPAHARQRNAGDGFPAPTARCSGPPRTLVS